MAPSALIEDGLGANANMHIYTPDDPFDVSVQKDLSQRRQPLRFESIDDIKTPSSAFRCNSFSSGHRYPGVGEQAPTKPPTIPPPVALRNPFRNNDGNTICSHNRKYERRHEIHRRSKQSTIVSPCQSQKTHDIPEEVFSPQEYAKAFATKTLPRLIYLYLLLSLPCLYFSRVDKIFHGATLSMEEIKEMALRDGAADHVTRFDHYLFETTEELPPAYRRLKARWEKFIDNLMEEYRAFNILSVLLLSAIMTMFQIHGATEDPITRYLAFWSLICALVSLLYGCTLSVRFGTMRKGYKAAEWALEAQKRLNAFWNVWIMLAMPVIWLTWSILTFITCIMTFMWRSQADLRDDSVFSVSPSTEFGFRIFICAVLGVGVIYGILMAKTLQRYGNRMDEAWRQRIDEYIKECQEASDAPLPKYLPEPIVESPQSAPGSPKADSTPRTIDATLVIEREYPGNGVSKALRIDTKALVSKPVAQTECRD